MTHLYRHFSSTGELLYVGISLSALQRLGQHKEHSDWFKSIARVEIEHLPTREEAVKAEREAIIRERPKHNIHHKRAAQEAVNLASKVRRLAAESKKDLTARIVFFHPVYTTHEAAEVLRVHVSKVNTLLRENRLGHFTMPNKVGRPIPHISGWQLLDYIESMVEPATEKC